MSRDTVKTLAGLLLIGIIIVATFLYGNAQHQKQVQQDQATKQTAASASPKATITPKTTPKPTVASATGNGQPTTTPRTGAGDVLIPLGALVATIGWYRYSRRLLIHSQITKS